MLKVMGWGLHGELERSYQYELDGEIKTFIIPRDAQFSVDQWIDFRDMHMAKIKLAK